MRISTLLIPLLAACAPPVPTYHDDVAPIVAKRCGDCHAAGPRAFTAANITQSMPAMLTAIDAKRMPPWLPEGGDVAWANDRTVTSGERKLLGDWLANPVMGLPRAVAPVAVSLPDVALTRSYRHVGQEAIRCFVVEPPAGNVAAYGWALDGDARAVAHHMSADLIAAADSAAVRQLDRGEGWDCTSLAIPAAVKMSFASSSTDGERFTYPEGYGMRVEDGDALVINVHLTGPTTTLDYGVNLWYARQPVKPTQLWAILAPSQLECPPSMRGEARCQLAEASKYIVQGIMPSRAENLAACGAAERYGVEANGRYPVSSSCEGDLFPGPQRVISVTAHAHLKAAAIRVSAQRPGGEWFTLLNIPRWRSRWEAVYAPAELLVIAGRVRIDCDFDNGPATQQSAVVPWSDPPIPPLLPVEISVWGDARKWPAEMCQARVELAAQQSE